MEPACSIYETFKFAGCRMASHQSDLYVKVDPVSRRVLREMLEDEKLAGLPTLFTENGGAGLWYEFPFAYDPWWEKRMELSSR